MGQTLSRTLSFSKSLSNSEASPSQRFLSFHQQLSFSDTVSTFLTTDTTYISSDTQLKIDLDDYMADSSFTFFMPDSDNILIRKVRLKNDVRLGIYNKTFMLKLIITNKNELDLKMKEVEILSSLNHKNIIQMIGYDVRNLNELKANALFKCKEIESLDENEIKKEKMAIGIIMEFLENNLQKKIFDNISRKKIFSKKEVTLLVSELISALLYLQFRRIYHGNLIAENVLISGDMLKIAHFNIAKDFSNERSTTEIKIEQNKQYFYPEFNRAVEEEREKIKYNVFKTDTFDLGILILYICTSKTPCDLYLLLQKGEKNEDKRALFRDVEQKYGKGIVELIYDLTNFDEDERKTILSLCFAPKKSYAKYICNDIESYYNLQRVSRTKFKTIKILGSGGFGEVNEVEYQNQKYAEKTIKNIDSRCLIDSMEEVLINAAMKHENIVKFYYYDIEEVNNRSDYYNLYSYIEIMDKSLDQEFKIRCKQVPKLHLTIKEINNLLFSIAKAMKYMQEVKNIAHSDIKPQNILMNKAGDIFKLCDFGISRRNLPRSQITSNLTIKGSPYYLAPELRDTGDSMDPRIKHNPFKADIFSLGLTILSIVTLLNFSRDQENEKKDREGYFLTKEVIKKILELYDKDLLILIKDMLKYNYKERMDYIGFYKRIYQRYKNFMTFDHQTQYKEIHILSQKCQEADSDLSYQSSFSLYQEMLSSYQEINDQEGIAYALVNLGNICKQLKDIKQAESYYEQSLEIGCKVLGYDHPRIALLLNNLAVVYSDLNNFMKAEVYFKQAIQIYSKHFGLNHQKIANFKMNMGSMYLTSKQLDKSLEIYCEALDNIQINHPPNSLKEAIVLNHIGSVFRKLNQQSKTLEYFEKSQTIFESITNLSKKDEKKLADLLQSQAKVHKDLKNYEKALEKVEKALFIYKKIFGEKHMELVTVYDLCGVLSRKIKKWEKALEFYTKALEIMEGTKKKNSITPILQDFSPKKQEKKSSFFSFVMNPFQIAPASQTITHETVAIWWIYNNIGIVHKEMKDWDRAIEYFIKASGCLKNEDNENNSEICNNIGSAFLEMGNHNKDLSKIVKAKEYYEEALKLLGSKNNNFRKMVEENLIITGRLMLFYRNNNSN